MISDVFGLNTVYERQIEDTWTEDPTFGYFVSGSGLCSIDRLDFSNETASNSPSPSPTVRRLFGSVSNQNYSYFGAGTNSTGTRICTIDRLDFSNEITSSPGNNLPKVLEGLAALSSSNYGYFSGGYDGSNYNCTIYRLDFSTETVSAPGKGLSQARWYLDALSSSDHGYFAGGTGPTTYVCTIDRIEFSTETVLAPGSYQLTQARYYLGALSSSDYGYFGGGDDPSGNLCTIDRLDFSTETVAAPGSYQLTEARRKVKGFSGSHYGYFGGGDASFVSRCTIDRLDFSTETVSAPGNNLTAARAEHGAVSSGTLGTNIKHLRKTSSTDIDGKPISSSYGYFAGGDYGNPTTLENSCLIDRLDFSNETVSSPSQLRLISKHVDATSSVFNSNYGYIFGSCSPPDRSRLEFSNETISTKPAAIAFSNEYAVSGPNYGYAIGEKYVSTTNTIERFDFSVETKSVLNPTVPRRGDPATFSTPSYGYFSKGRVYIDISNDYFNTNTTRLEFSTETTKEVVEGTSVYHKYRMGSFSNSNYGYYVGGDYATSTFLTCRIARFDFSTETNELRPAGVSERKTDLVGLSNQNYGYVAGGSNNPIGPPTDMFSTIDRLEFATETTGVLTSYLSQARHNAGAVPN